ncbi:BIG/ATPase V1 complex, subunit S1 [Ampelomyces quisqualis]|uniref:Protein BIG1 n=1 Tax=Ampelomyces quisqualis TaxID=50730 RepID=A0A6A5QW30_AMPQU|nr:BIG/ATPase V1 complex, subunit S1 [Ampelomyces quisqualis]
MAKTLVGALALVALPSALAFRDTSPFFLFSTADLNLPNTDATVAKSSQTTAQVLDALKDCPTQSYVVIEQRGVSSADYVDGLSAPVLSQYMGGKQQAVKTTFAVPDVLGQVDGDAIVSHLKSKCRYKAAKSVIAAPGPEKTDRMHSLQTADDSIDELIAQSEDYTVIYITTPVDERVAKAQLGDEHPPYEMENAFGVYEQFELKRDLSSHVQRANATHAGGLFERYQYFTPGIFMAFTAIIPLFLILLVGIRALTSLEVSYFAFSKEMGPNAQKKQ